jgi:hypothetical protein
MQPLDFAVYQSETEIFGARKPLEGGQEGSEESMMAWLATTSWQSPSQNDVPYLSTTPRR